MEHVDIPDSERHELKGASTASSGQVPKADGEGGTSFESLSLSTSDFLNASTTTSQLITAGTIATVLFSDSEVTSEGGAVSLSAAGLVTFNEAGVYYIRSSIATGRDATSGTASLFYRLYINDTVYPPAHITVDDSSDSAFNISNNLVFTREAGDTLKVEMLYDSGSGNAGPMVSSPIYAGWADSPGASMYIAKLEVS